MTTTRIIEVFSGVLMFLIQASIPALCLAATKIAVSL